MKRGFDDGVPIAESTCHIWMVNSISRVLEFQKWDLRVKEECELELRSRRQDRALQNAVTAKLMSHLLGFFFFLIL